MTMAVIETARDDRAAIDKAFSLLVAFGGDASTGLGVSELARRTSLSKSTAFRVLGMLERNAMVERVGKNYRLGSRLHELGREVYAPGLDRLRDVLLPYLTELFETTKSTVHLATLHGTDVLYLAKLNGHRTVAAPSRIGGRLPATCTSIGKVLLAYDPDAAAAALAAPLPRLTPRSTTDPASLEQGLSAIRRAGVATEYEESRLGVQCAAVPLLGRNGRPMAAMSVSAPVGEDMRPIIATLRRVCASAARAVNRTEFACTA
ncbi:MAG: IclR family transcriptional regulator [Actinomycetota bacterium]|nr:IclR family transcriptional regulator [Actinomycetota bacterium]